MLIAALASAAFMILADAAPTAAAADAAKPPAPATATADHKDKLVCKSEAVAGTHLPKKVCMLQSQIDANRASGRAALEKAQLNARGPAGN